MVHQVIRSCSTWWYMPRKYMIYVLFNTYFFSVCVLIIKYNVFLNPELRLVFFVELWSKTQETVLYQNISSSFNFHTLPVINMTFSLCVKFILPYFFNSYPVQEHHYLIMNMVIAFVNSLSIMNSPVFTDVWNYTLFSNTFVPFLFFIFGRPPCHHSIIIVMWWCSSPQTEANGTLYSVPI